MMHILLRDVRELEELVTENWKAGQFDPLDMELLRTRISGVRHLLEAVSGKPSGAAPGSAGEDLQATHVPHSAPAAHGSHATPVMPEAPGIHPAPAAPATHSAPVNTADTTNHEAEEAPVHASDSAAPHPGPEVQQREISFAKPLSVSTEPAQKEIPATQKGTAPAQVISPAAADLSVPPEASGEMLFSEDATDTDSGNGQHEKQILGEKFTAGKSVHDLLMTEKTRSDLKFSNIPIASLSGSIGTNDRFLFARELFDGNMELLHDTVRNIDQMHELREAFNYLRERFNWKKSETSLKFVELVKRRFPQNG
mgnify:FL=1